MRRTRSTKLTLLVIAASAVVGMVTIAAVAPRSTADAAAPAPVPLASKSGAYVVQLPFGGRDRDYRLHVPPAAASGRRLPLILNLHGATQNGLLQELQSGMDASSDRDGYLVAYPDGTRISTVLDPDPVAGDAQYGWNAGHCCGLPITENVNDVGFLLRVISDIATRTPVDTSRVYVTGMSNGGMMAYTMAARAAGHVAAISSVSGQVQLGSIRPARAVPTMEFHSVDDPIAKWSGVEARDPRLQFSVMQGIDKWVSADGCPSTAHTSRAIVGAPGSTSAGETATRVTYGPCRDGARVSLWRFTGSGHVWPGSTLNTGPPSTWILDGVGRGITLVDADETMWRFFRRYSLPG